MAYTTRTKDAALDNGRAADQNESVDNDIYFDGYITKLVGMVGPFTPAPTGGVISKLVKRTGLADATATEVFTITTTNEAGANDAGVYYCEFVGLAAHGIGPTGETSVTELFAHWARAINQDGSAGANSAVVLATTNLAASTAATKSVASVVITIVETSEYVQSVRFNVDISGTTITTADVVGMARLIYAGFTTPPVITSIG
jgi:hypothetical protein